MTNEIIVSIPINEFQTLLAETVRMELKQLKQVEIKPEQELITETELSKRLQRSKVTLNDWRKRGLLPFYRISRKIYYDWSECLASLKKIEIKRRPHD